MVLLVKYPVIVHQNLKRKKMTYKRQGINCTDLQNWTDLHKYPLRFLPSYIYH